MNRSKTTTDHDEIRRWAEARGGKPTAVKGTARGKRDPGMIRIDFPGYSGEGKLVPISWDEWFEKFDKSRLAMILQEETADGQKSSFNKLVSKTTAKQAARKSANKSSKSAKSAKSRKSRKEKLA
jgi:hypothetical protein